MHLEVTRKGERMTSSKDYLDYILEQLSGLEDIRYRAMMGEYILYYREKVVGGIYDDWFLIKNVKSARERMPDASLERPYEGAKEMLLVENIEDKVFLRDLFNTIYDELPAPKPKKKKWWLEEVTKWWTICRQSSESIK